MDIPDAIRADAHLTATSLMLPTRESTAWVVRVGSKLAVLRRLDPIRYPPGDSMARADLDWLHGFLACLAETSFVAPRPIAAFDDRSWIRHAGALWELVTYLDGEAVGWRRFPTLAAVGELLAQYHEASSTIRVEGQRPRATPLDGLRQRPSLGHVSEWLDQLNVDLERIGHVGARRAVIHGDCTAHNVLATGRPPIPSGVIDFALAYVEAILADVGFALWRSGRLHQDAVELDLARVRALVVGYHRRRPLREEGADAIAVYIRARGVQQAVKAKRRGIESPPLLVERVRWLAANHGRLVDGIGSALA